MRAFPGPETFMPRVGRAFVAALSLLVLSGALACSSPPPGPAATSSPSVSASNGPPEDRAAMIAAALSDDELVAQVLMPSVEGNDSTATAVAAVQRGLGGVILMGNRTVTDVKAFTDALQAATPAVGGQALPLLISTDQEYGFVNRISDLVQMPAAMAFGAAGEPQLTRAAWAAVGQELNAIGINVDNAPVADVIGPAGNAVIGSRSYGSRADVVGPQVAAVVSGLDAAGVAATLKHFPGHGNTTVDSHAALPVLTQSRAELEATDLAPFRAGIAAGAPIIMAGHLDVAAIDPGVPATFSSKVLVDLLRDDMGFTGLVISDSLRMEPARQWSPEEAAVRAFLAGNDLLLMPPSVDAARSGLLGALHDGRLSRERLVESVTRIIKLKLELAGKPRSELSVVNSADHVAAAAAVANAAITVLKGPCGAVLVPGPVRVTASEGRDGQVATFVEELTAAGVSVVTTGGAQVHLVGYGDAAADLAAGAAVTVAMDTPYILGQATSAVRVATYSSSRVSLRALAAVIAGQTSAPGRSPVPVPGLPASACSPS